MSIMEGVLSQRVTPLLKCVVLFLFIFTAKVLTSRPQETQDTRNSIQHLKPSHYVRTFTKYHHRRTIQRINLQDVNNYWTLNQEHPKVIGKRSVEITNTNDFFSSSEGILNLNQFAHDTGRENSVHTLGKKVSGADKNGSIEKTGVKKFQVMEAKIFTDPPTTAGSHISCLYKIQSVSMSVTPSYREELNSLSEWVVESDKIDFPGPLSDKTLPSGKIVQVEQCIDPQDSCYTLYKEEGDNVTVLGQGCWRLSETATGSCDNCVGVASIPHSKFCCCTKSYCNAEFKSLREKIIEPKAESTVDTESQKTNYSKLIALGVSAVIVTIVVIVIQKVYCKKGSHNDLSEGMDVEKGDTGSRSEMLATGLLCVDNLNLIEHIGQGKFGSVWRGTLGNAPVAVKLYSNANAWQREAAIYALPHISHPNLLKYYGSDSRPSISDGARGIREYLIVLELCTHSLRNRLEAASLTWLEFATLAHGLASALAHLHTPGVGKPCVVHRDVTSSNVLVCRGQARLADLGLSQAVPSRRDRAAPTTLTEAGTLRYLAPEALEGALDLSGARAALCAVDVFALGLVLWEMLWRCSGAHAGRTPAYAPPYQHHGLTPRPTLAQMQSLVSRNKARPPLPKGPVPEGRALKIATDTCDECWDHDAEARLTAVCVEERMAELKIMLHTQGPVIHDNNLHPHSANDTPMHSETDKNSNCTATQNSDVTTPLLYSHPHIGRNACIERNTHTNVQTHAELIHKSLKDISVPAELTRPQNIEENCLSVARVSHSRIPVQDYENSDRIHEVRSYQRPLDYVQNDVSSQDVDRGPKETNLLHDTKIDKPKWGIRKFFEKKLSRNPKVLETEVKLISESTGNTSVNQNGKTKTSIVNEKPSNINTERPSNLVLNQDSVYNFEGPCTLSPPNRTLSPTMMMESQMNRSENKVFKRLPSDESDTSKAPNQIFAVIVPKAKPTDFGNLIEMRSKASNSRGSSESINKQSVRTSISSQSIFKSQSESEDSTVKKRLSCDNGIISNASNSDRSSKASINLELRYLEDNPNQNFNGNNSPFDLNSDCSSSEDEHLMLLSENGGSKITMQTIPKNNENDKKKVQNDVLKETSQTKTDFSFKKHQYKYTNFDNECSDSHDKENLVNGYSGDNPVYLAALNGEINTTDLKAPEVIVEKPKSPKPVLNNLTIKRQRSLEHVSEIFTSAGDIHLQNPAGRVKTPGDLPVAVRRARRDRALQKGRASECNRLSLYDDRMMFGNSL